MEPGGSTAVYFMAYDVLRQVLERADDLPGFAAYVTATFRELTGARCCCLLVPESSGTRGWRALSVSPSRSAGSFVPPACTALLAAAQGRPGVTLELALIPGAARLAPEFTTAFVQPLALAGETLGAVALFDTPGGEEREREVRAFLDPVNALLALVLHHALYMARLEQVIEERTYLLARSADLYRRLFDAAPYGIALADATDGRLVKVNPALVALAGRPAAELEGQSHRVLHPPESVPKPLRAGFQSQVQTPGLVIEDQIVRPDGEQRTVEIRTQRVDVDGVAHLLGFFEDVTEKRQYLAALKERDAMISLLLDSTAEALYGVDAEGRCTFVNRACLRALGWDEAAELLGRTLAPLVHAPEGAGPPGPVDEVLRTGAPVHREATLLLRRDGSRFPAELWARPVVRDRTIGVVVTFFDVSARLKAEDERRQLEAQLAQAHKMEALGTLAGGIAHDFNNILSAILGYTELVRERVPQGSPEREDLSEVMLAGTRARELVKQILAFSRKAPPAAQALDLQLVVGEALRLLRKTLPSTVTFDVRLDEQAGCVLADPTQIHQVVMNLCTNASHAMRERGGRLTVDLSRREVGREEAARVAGLREGSFAVLTVADTGTGIDPAVLPRIFEPFFTTKRAGEGTGMGLAVVHGMVAQAGGAVAVESVVGQGTTFRVYLPLHSGTGAAEAAVEDPLAGQGRILLVDDEPALVKIAGRVLTGLGYQVTGLTSSLEALDHFRAAPHAFDAVVSDQTMPHLTGVQLAREVLALRPGLPVVLCTGYSESLDEPTAQKLGIGALLQKPVDRKLLGSTLRRLLRPG